jgi:intracellular multiplication protein IcmP
MAAPQQGSQPDNSAAMLWIIAAIFAAIAVIWYSFQSQIVSFYLYIKLYEVNILRQIFPNSYYGQLRNIILAALANPTQIKFNDLVLIGTTIGNTLRIPLASLLFLLGIVVYFANTTRVFKRNYNMPVLAKLEKNNWPQITPVVSLDLNNVDIDSGPWAMAMSPMQFCKRYKLLDEVQVERVEGMSRKDWDRIDVVLRRGQANKLFAMQLGPMWKGVERLTPHARALFAAFAARIAADTAPAAKLLGQISASSAGKLNFAGADALLKKHWNHKLVQEVVQRHAYELTVMAAMLEAARLDGVQASADFLWLKPLDRRLWYTLNTVGRQTPFAEVAGIFAHWVAEKESGRKLLVPMVDEATRALEVALKEVIYRPDEKK